MYTLTCTETIEYTQSFPDLESLHRYVAERALDLHDVTVGSSEREVANYLAKCDPSPRDVLGDECFEVLTRDWLIDDHSVCDYPDNEKEA